MVLYKLKEDGFLNPVEEENYKTFFMDEWEKLHAYGLGTVDEYPIEEDD